MVGIDLQFDFSVPCFTVVDIDLQFDFSVPCFTVVGIDLQFDFSVPCFTVVGIDLQFDFSVPCFTVDQNANYDAKRVHLENLYRMVQYCENKMDCRRTQQLEYFGERFDRRYCAQFEGTACDNCSSKVRLALITPPRS